MSFITDLARGKDGEIMFYKKYSRFVTRTDGRTGDFIIIATGDKIEVKTDSYCPNRYPNFIMERYRSGTKPGGPWQALEHGCKYFAYQFLKTGQVYLFETQKLVDFLDTVDFKPFFTDNGSYETTYYKVPRVSLDFIHCNLLDTLQGITVKTPLEVFALETTLEQNALLHSSNEDYHANKTHLSSSSLKTLLKSPEQFYVEHILGQKTEQPENPNFSEGSFVHSLILEPDKVDQYAIFPGLRKAGAAWEEFKAKNPSKTILSTAQVNRCEQLYKSFSALPIALNMVKGGFAEHTMLAEILDVKIKTRADYINVDKGYILDIKTTAMPTSIDAFKVTVAQYGYELSAALYCEAAREVYGKLFDFYWLVLSKSDNRCSIYRASTDTLSLGTALYTQALVLYKKCKETGVWRHEQPHTQFDSEYEIEEI